MNDTDIGSLSDWFIWERDDSIQEFRQYCAARGIEMRESVEEKAWVPSRHIRFHFIKAADEIRHRRALIIHMHAYLKRKYP